MRLFFVRIYYAGKLFFLPADSLRIAPEDKAASAGNEEIPGGIKWGFWVSY